MCSKDYDFLPELGLQDITPAMRVLILLILATVVLMLTACGTVQPIEHVERHPPAASMVLLAPLPAQTDPSLGGIFKGYANAARQYRECIDRHAELQDWVNSILDEKQVNH